MGQKTAIDWCDHTFNPWWGCWKIAPECKHCYAAVFDHRLGGAHWERTGPRRFFKPSHWAELRKWNRKAELDGVRRRVFIGSMCDWAERHPVHEIALQMDLARTMTWNLIRECKSLDFLMLTKRIDDAAELLPWSREPNGCTDHWHCDPDAAAHVCDRIDRTKPCPSCGRSGGEPWSNVWLGTTAGTVPTLRYNVRRLREIRAAVRFVSCEPILEDIPPGEWDTALGCTCMVQEVEGAGTHAGSCLSDRPVHWLIVGDESGHGRRPASADWVRVARDAAERHGVAFFFKQWCGDDVEGISGPKHKGKRHLPILDGKQHEAWPQ